MAAAKQISFNNRILKEAGAVSNKRGITPSSIISANPNPLLDSSEIKRKKRNDHKYVLDPAMRVTNNEGTSGRLSAAF